MSALFCNCSKIKSLPDISIWNTINIKYITGIFSGCCSLESLPDISKWNTVNIEWLKGLFYGCKYLKEFPDISKWNTENTLNIAFLFGGCSSLKSLPDISKWNVNKICFIGGLFFNCLSLESLPDISKWNIFNYNFNINNYISFIESQNFFENKKIMKEDTEKINSINVNYNNDLFLENLTYEILELKQYTKEEFIVKFMSYHFYLPHL